MSMSDSKMRLAVVSVALLLGVSRIDAQSPLPASGFAPPESQTFAPSFPAEVPADSMRPRPRATEYSDAYATRLAIHRVGSYVMLPVFAAEYVLGNRLMNGGAADWVKPTHGLVAGGIGLLFAVNTVTGVWNLADSRHDEACRTRRLLHSALMIGAEAGFVWTASLAGESDDFERSSTGADKHRTVALASIGISTVGTVMMWLWRN
jgi:hypothetical protein